MAKISLALLASTAAKAVQSVATMLGSIWPAEDDLTMTTISSQLDALKAHTTVVADTGDFQQIAQY